MSEPILLVVRRGALRRFHTLQRKTSNLNVKVIWDRREGPRRQAERPVTQNRRAGDRRGAHGFTWSVADFSVAEASPQKR